MENILWYWKKKIHLKTIDFLSHINQYFYILPKNLCITSEFKVQTFSFAKSDKDLKIFIKEKDFSDTVLNLTLFWYLLSVVSILL